MVSTCAVASADSEGMRQILDNKLTNQYVFIN
jgi:hypothetical protein